MKFAVVLFALLAGSQFASASDIRGQYQCDNGGDLVVAKKGGIGQYSASLNYPNGASSTLNRFEFQGESLKGRMFPDDDGTLGFVVISSGGQQLRLHFNDGTALDCLRKF